MRPIQRPIRRASPRQSRAGGNPGLATAWDGRMLNTWRPMPFHVSATCPVPPHSARNAPGDTFDASTIRHKVNTINSVEMAFTSGVTAILIIE